jgi:hypothetical protein
MKFTLGQDKSLGLQMTLLFFSKAPCEVIAFTLDRLVTAWGPSESN